MISVSWQRIYSTMCTVMLLSNLAHPTWMTIGCHTKAVEDIVCVENTTGVKPSNQTQFNTDDLMLVCRKQQLRQNNSCLKISQQIRSQASKLSFTIDAGPHFNDFLLCIDTPTFPPYFDDNFTQVVELEKYSSPLPLVKAMSVSGDSDSALVVQRLRRKQISTGENLVKCGSQEYKSVLFVLQTSAALCSQSLSDKLIKQKQYCSTIFFKGGRNSCFHSPITRESWSGQKSSSSFSLGTFQAASHNSSQTISCDGKGLIPCSVDFQVCYNFSDICLFRMDRRGDQFPCKHGEHIQDCSNFECNMMFKCPGYYCIPWRRVCDGEWNCPSGRDESYHYHSICSQTRTCKHMFQCHNTKRCIHLGDVCDGIRDCPSADDENFCSLHSFHCFKGCTCAAFTLLCTQKHFLFERFDNEYPHSLLMFDGCSFRTRNPTFLFSSLLTAAVTNSGLTTGCALLTSSSNLCVLKLSHNKIQELQQTCFRDNRKLYEILLNHNLLTTIGEHTFSHLKALKILNLSHNCLISQTAFDAVNSLNVDILSVSQNAFVLSSEFFKQICVKRLVETSQFRLCCILPETAECSLQLPWHFKCENLLPNLALKVCFKVIGAVVLLANMVSILQRRIIRAGFNRQSKSTKAFELTVLWVNVSDVTCFLFLTALWIADIFYGDDFVLEEENWRSSIYCLIIFLLLLNFSILHPLLLSFLSFSRLRVVKDPLSTRFKDAKRITKYLFRITLLCCSVSLALVISAGNLFHALPSMLCSPFIDPHGSKVLFNIQIWMVSFHKMSLAVFIAGVYVSLIISLHRSQKEFSESKGKLNASMLIQLVIVTCFIWLSWIPTSFIYITASLLETYSPEMLPWTQVAVAPMLSIVNPVVFVVTTSRST